MIICIYILKRHLCSI